MTEDPRAQAAQRLTDAFMALWDASELGNDTDPSDFLLLACEHQAAREQWEAVK